MIAYRLPLLAGKGGGRGGSGRGVRGRQEVFLLGWGVRGLFPCHPSPSFLSPFPGPILPLPNSQVPSMPPLLLLIYENLIMNQAYLGFQFRQYFVYCYHRNQWHYKIVMFNIIGSITSQGLNHLPKDSHYAILTTKQKNECI